MTAVEPVEPPSTRLQGWMQRKRERGREIERETEGERERERETEDAEGENKDLGEGKEETKERTDRWVKIGTC